ncbi:MAG TPA: threonine--tRNA ligase [Candidatus Saccharimonadales bacterium]|nr:threonine--tRNA ligase [Candidatus Saccharimonadales bacterium]
MSNQKQDELQIMRHSAAHVFATALKRIWPEVKLGVGPAVDNGFYYDLDLGDKKVSEDDFAKIEKEMKKVIAEDHKFERSVKTIDNAIKWAKEKKQPYKLELLNDLKRAGTTVAKDLNAEELGTIAEGESKVDEVGFYSNGDFEDLCRGPHVESTGKVGAFKLMKISGVYWRGKEGNPQMQRLYGVAFKTQEDLDKYLDALEQAKARDHRLLGKQMDLFAFSDLVGPGLPLFTPRGTTIRRLLKDMLTQFAKKYGGMEVEIPHLARRELYEISGHAQKFSGELFNVQSHYDVDFVMKPVNCPHHTQIFASQPRSYKDLPISYAQTSMQYRDEKPGQIGGLTRVRAITVDDNHVFCTPDQIKQVVVGLCKLVEEFHSSLGMYGDHWVSLSVRDYSKPDAYVGDVADWDKAENMLEELAKELGLNAKRMEGEAALYGPKLDFMYKDVLGNERQLSTVQLDFSTPKRFGLTYTDKSGNDATPVMVHCAVLGSYERFMAILIEKTAGWLPFWLAPEQIRILTINDTVLEYVKEVESVLSGTVLMTPLKYNELRYKVDDRNESLGRKIRDAVELKIPVQLIVGPKDVEAKQVSARVKGEESKVSLEELSEFLQHIN